MKYTTEDIAQKIQDLYFENGAKVSRATWDETLRLLDQHSAHLVERIEATLRKELHNLNLDEWTNDIMLSIKRDL